MRTQLCASILLLSIVAGCSKSQPEVEREGPLTSVTVVAKNTKKISVESSHWLNGQPTRCSGTLTLNGGGSSTTWRPFDTAFVKGTNVADTTKVGVTLWKDASTLIGEVDFLYGDLRSNPTANIATITLLDDGYEVERNGKKAKFRYYTKL